MSTLLRRPVTHLTKGQTRLKFVLLPLLLVVVSFVNTRNGRGVPLVRVVVTSKLPLMKRRLKKLLKKAPFNVVDRLFSFSVFVSQNRRFVS